MFEGATSFNSDVSGWKTKKVESMDRMFKNAKAFNQNLDDWGKLDKVTRMNEMFYGASSFNQTICWEKLDEDLEMNNIFHYSGGCFDYDCVDEDLWQFFACGPWGATSAPETIEGFTLSPVPSPGTLAPGTVTASEYEPEENTEGDTIVLVIDPDTVDENLGSPEVELEVGRATASGARPTFRAPSMVYIMLATSLSLLCLA